MLWCNLCNFDFILVKIIITLFLKASSKLDPIPRNCVWFDIMNQ